MVTKERVLALNEKPACTQKNWFGGAKYGSGQLKAQLNLSAIHDETIALP